MLTNDERLGCARLLAKCRSFRVLPMVPNQKEPAILDWRNQATNDLAKIEIWWSGRYKGYNVGVATGGGLLVLDVDTKKGKLGLESLERLERELNLPWGMLRIKTPSGGLHIYLKAPEDFEVRQRVNNLSGFPSIDVTHCVASVGSSINGKQYEVLTPPESYRGGEAAPDEIIDLCRQAATKIRKTIATPVVPLDREHAIKRAIDGLSRHPIVREFKESDRKIYNLAIKLRTFGISENTCWQLICKYLSEAGRTEPQFDPEWIEQKVRNAYTYGPGAPGECSGLFEFGDSGGRALSAVGDWDEPTNLWSADTDPPNLPVGVVPELVERYARDRGRRLGVEPGGVAALSIVALSSLIHASNCIQVQQKDPHWTERPILWAMLIGNPGSNKSATLTQVIAPMAHLEQTWKQEFVRKLAAHTDFEATNDKFRASTPRSDQKNLAPYSRRKGRSCALEKEAAAIPSPPPNLSL